MTESGNPYDWQKLPSLQRGRGGHCDNYYEITGLCHGTGGLSPALHHKDPGQPM